MSELSRRQLLSAATAQALMLASSRGALAADPQGERAAPTALPAPPKDRTAESLASDEAFWNTVAAYYPEHQPEGEAGQLLNLEHGYWGTMANPVRDAYLEATQRINLTNSVYARKDYRADARYSVERIARALGVNADEIALTRNATEAIHNLIRQYRGLEPGDAVLYADADYPQFKTTMAWLEQARGVKVVRINLPPRAEADELRDRYLSAIRENPSLKLMLLTHASNQHGMVLPVRAIADEARSRGIDVICDCAQSWGLVDFRLEDLGVDWAGFNLHKWIGSPVGVGALYMRRGTLDRVAPYPGESDPENNRVYTRIHSGTSNFAAMVTVPAALDFHEAVGGSVKRFSDMKRA